ncbi:MAG: response regulator [Candidatus Glassbacteria bacterium]|nr:response regulator [Candidatus Glassbacteria bacterium]
MLEQLGHEAEYAKNGTQAIEMYEQAKDSGQPFDVVILDLTIPGGMGGRETIEKLREIDPDVRAIVASGYSNDPVMSEPEKHGFRGVVPKPYRIEKLREVLQSVLNETNG